VLREVGADYIDNFSIRAVSASNKESLSGCFRLLHSRDVSQGYIADIGKDRVLFTAKMS
jgi:hypothetical protein